MTWYEDNFKRRMPITINSSLIASGVIQFQITIPTYWDDFWNNVRSDGFDVHLVDQNGLGMTFERLTWNTTTKAASFRSNYGGVKEANVMHTVFIYWNAPDETSDPSTSVAVAPSPLFAYVYLGAPFRNIVNLQNRSGLSTVPTTIFQKDPDELIDIWYPISQLLAPSQLPINERLEFLFVNYIDMEVLNSAGADQPSMYPLGEIRIINGWVKLRVQSGTVDTDYVVRLIIQDTNSQKFVLSSLLQVRKLLPS